MGHLNEKCGVKIDGNINFMYTDISVLFGEQNTTQPDVGDGI